MEPHTVPYRARETCGTYPTITGEQNTVIRTNTWCANIGEYMVFGVQRGSCVICPDTPAPHHKHTREWFMYDVLS